MDEEQIKALAIQLISAIGFMHSNDFAHRDVKMGNILMDKDGYLQVCDFGMAKKLTEG